MLEYYQRTTFVMALSNVPAQKTTIRRLLGDQDMATKLDPSTVENLQMIEVVVSGPDDANRLFTITGSIPVNIVAFNTSTARQEPPKKEPFTLLLGPTLTRRQFHKSIAATFPLAITVVARSNDFSGSMSWSVVGTDADWDGESQRVELRFEVNIDARGNGSISLLSVGFQVTILAQIGDA